VTTVGGVSPFTYLWQQQTYTVPVVSTLNGGCYTVQVTDAAGCAKSTTFCLMDTGFDEISFSGPSVYVNPFTSELFISGQDFSFRLIDPLGRIIAERDQPGSDALINCTQFAKGVYIVQLVHGDRSTVKKIVLE
jgi:hypothetical protein